MEISNKNSNHLRPSWIPTSFSTINYALAVPLTVAQLAGVPIGVRIVHAVRPAALRRAMAWICIGVGAWLALRIFVA